MAKRVPKAAAAELFDITERLKTAPCVPALREAVRSWREGGYKGATQTTQRLLKFWFGVGGHRTASGTFRYHAAQREAVETLIYVWEVQKVRTRKELLEHFARDLRGVPLPDDDSRPRYALKMATGSGKTKVLALLVAWQFLNAMREGGARGEDYACSFLLLAPNVIVYERLIADFGGGRIFLTDPVIPEDFRSFWDLDVWERDARPRPERAGLLVVTNIQQFYDRASSASEEPEPLTAVLGPAPSGSATDVDLREVLARRDGKVVALNDEAHHAYDGTAWDRILRDLNTRRDFALQVDVSATPRMPDSGTLFPWTVYDYPLRQAILDAVVKRPIRGIAKVPEVNSVHASVRYEGFLVAAVERWREYRQELAGLKKHPLLFVMAHESKDADDIALRLRERYPEDFADDKLLVIHTDRDGEVSKKDLELARRASRTVDSDQSPVNALVSVLMLREGWDVSNVTVVLGLRPFTAKANILPEQAIGRGLRLMFRGQTQEYIERVDVIGTQKFMEFLTDLEKIEDVRFDTFEVGKDKLRILTIQPEPERAAWDLSLPSLSPVLVRKRSLADEIAALDVASFDLPPVTLHLGDLGARTFTYEGRDILTDATEFVRQYAVPEPQTPQEVIGYYTRRIAEQVKLPSSFAALAPKVREFFEVRAFGRSVDLDDPKVLRAISTPLARFITEKVFSGALLKVAITQREPAISEAARPLSSCESFPWSGRTFQAHHTVFNLLACDSDFEVTFAKWLDDRDEVAAFAKLPARFGFSVEYLDEDYNLRSYYPDFAVRCKNGRHLLIETKGLESTEVPFKDRAARVWCEHATALTGTSWSYLKVLERQFQKLAPVRLEELFMLDPRSYTQTSMVLPSDVPATMDGGVLEGIYALVSEGKSRKALARIFDMIDDLLLVGQFSECDRLLASVQVSRLDPITAIGFLSVSLQAKDHLPGRAGLFQRIEEWLRPQRSVEEVHQLLRGLH